MQEQRIERYSGVPDIDNKERLINMKSKILTDVNSKEQILSCFDELIFDEIVLYVVIGGYTSDRKIDPYMIRFIIRDNDQFDANSNLTKEFIAKHNNVDKIGAFYNTVLDFNSNQKFNTFEFVDKGYMKVEHDFVRVRFETEKY